MEEIVAETLASEYADDRQRRYRRRRCRRVFRNRNQVHNGNRNRNRNDANMSTVDRTQTLNVLILMEASDDCDKVKSIFDSASQMHGQPVSVVSFTCVHDAHLYLNLDFSLTTDDCHYSTVNWQPSNWVEPVTVNHTLLLPEEPLRPMIPTANVIVVDEVNQLHPDFLRLIPDAFSQLKLMVLSADQSLAIREMDLLNSPLGFEAEAVERPWSTTRFRRRIEGPVADVVCSSLRGVLTEFILDINDTVRRGV